MKKLIGRDINGQTIILTCDDAKAVARAKRQYAKVGIALESYDVAIRREAKRLMSDKREAPKYRF